MNKLAQHRIKILKKNADLNQINPVERIIKDSNGDYISMAKSLSTHLPYKGKLAWNHKKKKKKLHPLKTFSCRFSWNPQNSNGRKKELGG